MVYDFLPSFITNKNNTEFILPVCGMYERKIYGYTALVLPIHPEIAILLLEQKAREEFTRGNTIRKFCQRRELLTQKRRSKMTEIAGFLCAGFLTAGMA